MNKIEYEWRCDVSHERKKSQFSLGILRSEFYEWEMTKTGKINTCTI